MDKEKTKSVAAILVSLHLIIQAMDELHKKITGFIIQKGNTNVKTPDNFDHRGN